MKNIFNQLGISLPETFLGLGIIAAASIGFMKMQENVSKSQLTNEAKSSELELKRLITAALLDKQACVQTFSGAVLGGEVTQIKNNNSISLFEKNKIYEQNTLKILSMVTQDKNQLNADGSRNVDLVINLERVKKNVYGSAKQIKIPLTVVSSGVSQPITSCFSSTDSLILTAMEETCLSLDAVWDSVSKKCYFENFKVFNTTQTKFSVDSNGNVGIGTLNPVAKLDVKGSIKLGSAGYSVGASCSVEGEFAYDENLHKPIFCNQSLKWETMGGDGLGSGQTWVDVTASRELNTTYVNNTSKPIKVNVVGGNIIAGSSWAKIEVNGVVVSYYTTNAYNGLIEAVVPAGANYRVSSTGAWIFKGSGGITTPNYGWRELR